MAKDWKNSKGEIIEFTDTIRRNRRRIIMGKLIYEILVNSLRLLIKPILENIIIFFVGEIAHEIAYSFSPGGKLGSLIYWITKLLSFIMMWAVLYFLIIIIQFILKYWIWFLIGLSAVLLVVLVIIIVEKKMKI